jgi:hypothetical protein
MIVWPPARRTGRLRLQSRLSDLGKQQLVYVVRCETAFGAKALE